MRGIKFRAYHLDWNEYFEKGTDINSISYNSQFDMIDLDRVLWEQYTGIKDKNGVEIYEGDIVKTSGENIYVVEFFDGKFNPVSDLEGSNWEVIGNIHQDSDLLVDDIERMIPDDIGNDIHEFLHGGYK